MSDTPTGNGHSEPIEPGPRCESCGAGADVKLHDGSTWCDECDTAAREYEDHHCCGLKDGHDGCCAYFCSMCNGVGTLGCIYDDLGCICGLCDGFGGCTECGGMGWFNDMGDPCIVAAEEAR